MRTIPRLSRPRARLLIAGLALSALVGAGCGSPRTESVSRRPAAAAITAGFAASPDYPVVFPDVLEISVRGKPECSGRRLVYPDGRIDLGGSGSVLAEGCTAAEITRRIAETAGVPAENVLCRVAEARSRFVYVLGPGADRPRAVSYTGPEHVTQFLQRARGTAADARPTEVRVIRRNVARGTPSETFRVDLAAVRMGDARTDIVVEPNDEIHVADDRGLLLVSFRTDRSRP